jgi:PAS domain S-box-containing protein
VGDCWLVMADRMERGEIPECGRQALSTPGVIVKNNTLEECTDCPLAAFYESRGALSVRLEHAGRIMGLLTVSCRAEFSADETEQGLLQEIAGDISIALHNIELQKEKEKSEIALRESEERFRIMVESTPMSILLARAGRYIFANPSCAQLLGYHSPNELLGKEIFEIFAPEYHHLFKKRLNRIEQENSNPLVELQVMRKNGERVWIFSTSHSIMMDGEATVMIVAQDIRALKDSQEQHQRALKEKEILLQELYHRTKNNMQVIQTMLALRESYVQDVQLQHFLKDVQEKIFAMALVHQKLYESQDLSSIDLKEYFEELVQYLELSFEIHRKRIKIEFDLESVQVLIDTAIPCGLILSELITNAYKYAFPAEREGKILVRLKRIESNAVLIEVSDNGVGLSEDYEIREGDTMGLETVFGIVQHQLAGEIKMNSQAGLSWQICFKERAIQPRV